MCTTRPWAALEVADEIARVAAIWGEARQRWGASGGGPFLYGAFTNADAMYAPMVSRFRTYGVALDETCTQYIDAVTNSVAFKEWEAAARTVSAVMDFDIFSPAVPSASPSPTLGMAR